MISVEHLTKRFGRFKAVDDLSFSVADGEAVALWGPNGAGKTTIIRCVLGLLRCKGAITVAGQSTRRQGKAARRLIGYVPQELSFYDDFRAYEALRLFARLKRAPLGRVAVVLGEVGLSAHCRKRVCELSGGMKQRLALASALLADPPILILDELTSNLDASAQRGFMHLLRGLKKRGKTILFTSHRLEEVDLLADRVLLLESGRLKTACPPREMSASPDERLVMKVYLDDAGLDRALEALVSRGFNAFRNGCAVHVAVAGTEKAAPLKALAEARISVLDFDLTQDDEPGQMPKGERRHG